MTKAVFSLRSQQRLALLVMAFAFPLAGATLILPWLLILWVIHLVRVRRFRWERTPYDFPFAVFLAFGLVAGLMSSLPWVALGSWFLAALAFAIVIQMAVRVLRESPSLASVLHKAFGLGTLCAAIYGLLVFYVQHLDRAQLLTLGPNALGFGLMTGIFLSVPLLEESSPWPEIFVVILIVSTVALIVTFSRDALYGIVAGGAVYVSLARGKLRWRFLLAAALSLLFGLAMTLASPLILGPWADNLGFATAPRFYVKVRAPIERTALLRRTVEFLFSVKGQSDRLWIWRVDVLVIRHHPWFGVGLGVFPFISHQAAAEIPNPQQDTPQGTPAHSLYLNLAAEVGIPGAVAFAAMPLAGILWALKRRDALRDAEIAAVVGMMAAEVRDTILTGFHMSLGFFLILALLVASSRAGKTGARREPAVSYG